MSLDKFSNREMRLMVKAVNEVLWWLESNRRVQYNVPCRSLYTSAYIPWSSNKRHSVPAYVVSVPPGEIAHTDAVLHSPSLEIFGTILLERGFIASRVLQQRQGARGRRQAHNFICRKTWRYIEEWFKSQANSAINQEATHNEAAWKLSDLDNRARIIKCLRYYRYIERRRRHISSQIRSKKSTQAWLNIGL